MSKLKVLVAGSIGLDDVSTPFGAVHNVVGGSAIFASLASSLFTKTAVLGVIGNDFPKNQLQVLEEKKIDITQLQESKKPTMRWKAHYGADINIAQTDYFSSNALDDFNPVVPKKFSALKYALCGVFKPAQQLQLVRSFAKRPTLLVCDTIEHSIAKDRQGVLDMIRCTDIVLMNDAEARLLFNTPNLAIAAQNTLALDSTYAVIKKGEHGCLLFSKKNHFACVGYPLEVVRDPTGCGDSFAGALIGYLAATDDTSEKNMRRAVVVASAVASFNAESFSFERLSQVTKKDVNERVKEFKEFVTF